MARQTPEPALQSAGQVNPEDLFADSSEGWLGVGVSEVSADQARQLKLGSVYGVMISEVAPNSPAAKAGIRKGDVITEFNGMRVEGAAEFRRVVRETPPGRTAQIVVWRDGHSEKLSAEIAANTFFNGVSRGGGKPRRVRRSRDNHRGSEQPVGSVARFRTGGGRSFGPRFAPGQPPALYGRGAAGATPVLGVAAQNLSGQLGEYFGAPDGEGVLVTEVRQGSAGRRRPG